MSLGIVNDLQRYLDDETLTPEAKLVLIEAYLEAYTQGYWAADCALP